MNEQHLALLSEYDFIAVVDKSGSMSTPDMGGRSRWAYMQETLVSFCRDLQAIDSDGIGVVIFSGSGQVKEDGVTADRIATLLESNRPSGSTPLAEALEAALSLAGKSAKKDFIIVFTDGTPDDPEKVKTVIKRQAASQATDDACTILFVQVGHDPSATAYLRSLDDALTGAKFDIVDAKTISELEKFSSTTDLIFAAISD